MLPRKNLIMLLGIVGGIVIFMFLWILPARSTRDVLDMEVAQLNSQIEEQKILAPVYDGLLKKAEMKPPEMLTSAQIEPLGKGDANKISEVLGKLARENNLTLVAFNPDMETLIDESGHMLIQIGLQGNFFDLYGFLNKLCQIPYLEGIEQILISSESESKDFKMKIWLNQE
jgi:hypothetical protein